MDLPANGFTVSNRSLGGAPDFNESGIVRRLGPRIDFVDLRNTVRDGQQGYLLAGRM